SRLRWDRIPAAQQCRGVLSCRSEAPTAPTSISGPPGLPRGDPMKRREFITFVGGMVITWPVLARAQQPKVPVVGFIRDGSAEANARNAVAFRKGLNESGYVEGQNVKVEYHWLEGQYDHLPALLADLVRRQVAVIATPGTSLALAAKAATTTIPIVFGVGEDP